MGDILEQHLNQETTLPCSCSEEIPDSQASQKHQLKHMVSPGKTLSTSSLTLIESAGVYVVCLIQQTRKVLFEFSCNLVMKDQALYWFMGVTANSRNEWALEVNDSLSDYLLSRE